MIAIYNWLIQSVKRGSGMKRIKFSAAIVVYLLGLLAIPTIVAMCIEYFYLGAENLHRYHLVWVAFIISLPGLLSPSIAENGRRSRRSLYFSVSWFFAVAAVALFLINSREVHAPMIGYTMLILAALAPGLTGLLSLYQRTLLRKVSYISAFIYAILMLLISM